MRGIDIDIESNAMEGRAARHLEADRANLPIAPAIAGQPNARTAIDALSGKTPFVADRADHPALDTADPGVQVNGLFEHNDRVDDDLAGAVPGR